MAAIQLTKIAFAYDRRPVFGGISLQIEAGERVAVLGPNGSGKSTLLKLMSGVLPPARGHVELDGRALRALPRRLLAQRVAVVSQEFIVPFAFTAREIVELGRTPYARFLGGATSADQRAIEKAMRLTDTAGLAGRVLNELSGGERQRVMIAMALAQEPQVLLLDEPTQQLDITRQTEILDLVAELNCGSGLTVVAAIHDLNLAGRYFSRLIVLHHGAVLADGSPAEVLRKDFLEKAYDGPVDVLPAHNGSIPIVLPLPRFHSNGRK